MIDRPRLQRLALRKVQQEKPTIQPCVKCGQDSFLFDFRRTVTTKPAKIISFVLLILFLMFNFLVILNIF